MPLSSQYLFKYLNTGTLKKHFYLFYVGVKLGLTSQGKPYIIYGILKTRYSVYL